VRTYMTIYYCVPPKDKCWFIQQHEKRKPTLVS